MAPILDGTQSVLGYLVGQYFNFQPLCLNSPTAWVATELPPGVTINAGTGLISGPCTAPGVYVVSVTATNSDGSAMATYTFGIEAAAASMATDIDATMDVISKAVTLTSGVPLASSADVAGSQSSDAVPPVLCVAKYDDDIIFSVRLAKNGTTISPAVTGASFALKETSNDAELVTSTTFESTGAGDATRYRVYAKLAGDALKSAVGDGDGAVQARQPFIAQLSFTYTNPTGGFGPSDLTITSDNFGIVVVDSL
jgi:hypothetical protein